MSQLKYFQPTGDNPFTVQGVAGTTINVSATANIVAGMTVSNPGLNINTTVASITNGSQFVVANVTNITSGVSLNIGTWVSAVVGAQGNQGAAGSPGGAQGPQGNQAGLVINSTSTLAPGSNATVTDVGSPGSSLLNFGIPRGYQGNQGATGAQGAQGAQGNQGTIGTQGSQGSQGFQGYQGVQGYQGDVGAEGVVYSATDPGSVYRSSIWIDTSVPNTDFRGPQGATGAQGTPGATGATGATGPTGATGATGPQGFQGASSVSNDVWIITGSLTPLPVQPSENTTTVSGNLAHGFSKYLCTVSAVFSSTGTGTANGCYARFYFNGTLQPGWLRIDPAIANGRYSYSRQYTLSGQNSGTTYPTAVGLSTALGSVATGTAVDVVLTILGIS